MIDRFGSIKRYLPAALLLVVMILISYVRLRLLHVPLERDEGEFAYFGQLILRGIPPYSLAYSLKLPGIFYAYALIMQAFGQSTEGIRIGLLAVNVITIGLLFLITKQFYDEYAGIAASASYAVLSLSPSVLGILSHATHFVMLFVLAGLLILVMLMKSDRPPVYYLLCGIFFGIGFTMKQHAAFFMMFPIAYIFMMWIIGKMDHKNAFLRSLFYLSGAALPWIVICLYLYLSGAFDKFWFWTIEYAREYVSEISVGNGVKYFFSQTLNIVKPSVFLWLLAGLGLVTLFARRESKENRFFFSGFLLLSLLAITPGFYFREHYYVMLLPAASMLIGISVRTIKRYSDEHGKSALSLVVSLGIFLVAISHTFYYDRDYYFIDSPEEVGRIVSGENPFPESPAIAKYVEENTSPDDRILVLGSEPQIYFYSRRLSATGHIYMYGLMENQKYARSMQQEMIREIVSSNPEFIVVVTTMKSWLIRRSSDTTVLDWANRYAAEKYDLVGIADKIGPDRTIFLWGRDALQYAPQSRSVIYLFKKKRFS
jgi:hypothetical protein